MKKFGNLCLSAAVVALVLINSAAAQEEQPIPVEIWACNFINGSDMNDLEAVNDDYNDWADDNGITNHFSNMLTPMFYSPDNPYDVLYLDGWSDGAALGAGYSLLYSESFSEVSDAFDAVIDCESHAYFGGVQVVPWSEERDGGPVQFQDCTVRENRTTADALEAINAFAGGGDGPGLGGFAVLLPFLGQPQDADYSFKLLAVFNSYQDMGSAFDFLFRGDGFQVANTTVNTVMDCDRARMYDEVTVREMQQPE